MKYYEIFRFWPPPRTNVPCFNISLVVTGGKWCSGQNWTLPHEDDTYETLMVDSTSWEHISLFIGIFWSTSHIVQDWMVMNSRLKKQQQLFVHTTGGAGHQDGPQSKAFVLHSPMNWAVEKKHPKLFKVGGVSTKGLSILSLFWPFGKKLRTFAQTKNKLVTPTDTTQKWSGTNPQTAHQEAALGCP